jgi:hypothetical protein
MNRRRTEDPFRKAEEEVVMAKAGSTFLRNICTPFSLLHDVKTKRKLLQVIHSSF